MAPATNIAADSQARAVSTAEATNGARKNIIFTTFQYSIFCSEPLNFFEVFLVSCGSTCKRSITQENIKRISKIM